MDVGYDVPAEVGMAEAEVETPCLVVDLAALERNIARMQAEADAMGVALRVHGKMHKSADVAQLQIAAGAVGVCCQKVSEAEAFARAGVADILVSNQVRGARKLARLARLPKLGVRVAVCVDDAAGVAELAEAVRAEGTDVGVLVEIDVGAARCGVAPGAEAVALAQAVVAAGLPFVGLQAYHGGAQHIANWADREAAIASVVEKVRLTLGLLEKAGIPCPVVTGAGTGTYPFEGGSGVFTELQCGSYAFMDADYGRVLGPQGTAPVFENALFVLTEVMSTAGPGRAVCDAGLKVMSLESGLPVVFGREDVRYAGASDEHGTLEDPGNVLRVGDRLRLVPGHIDPTCNLHDWYVGLRDGRTECLWPVTARGKAY